MYLKVQKIDSYQFVGKEFTIVVTLPEGFPDISQRTSNLPLKVDVSYDDEVSQFDPLDRNFNPNFLEIVTNSNIDRTRKGVVTLRLNEASANHNNRKFVVRFMAFTLEGDLNSLIGYSIPFTVVRFRLKIKEEFSNMGSYVWMKDVGGKDKSIDLNVSVVDTEDNPVLNRRVPLRVALLYSNGTLVPQQDILQLSPDTQLLIGPAGSTRIKCRINEVSSRHQGQLFQILVSPDFDLPSPLADISPARSVPVEVKSKINSSHKRKVLAMLESSSAAAAGMEGDAGMGEDALVTGMLTHGAGSAEMPGQVRRFVSVGNSSSASGSMDQSDSGKFPSILPLSSVLSGTPRGADSVAPDMSAGSQRLRQLLELANQPATVPLVAIPAVPDIATARSTVSPRAAASAMASAAASGPAPTRSASSSSVASLQALRTMQSAAWAGAPPAAVDPSSVLSPAVLNAVRELMRFADTAYVSLASLQWVPVGQLPATHPETGIPVPGDRILYSMTNPNKVIAGVAERYQQVVLPQLVILERALAQVDAASASAAGAGSSSSSGRSSGGAAVSPAERDAAARRAASSTSSHPTGSAGAVSGSASADASERRVVCLRRGVFASRTLPDGTTQEVPLGAAVFDDSTGKQLLVGFYNMDAAKKLVFTEIPDLLKELAPADAAAANPSASTVAQCLLGITPEEAGGAPVRLHRQANSSSSSSGAGGGGVGVGEYDLAALYENWRSWTASDRLNVQLT